MPDIVSVLSVTWLTGILLIIGVALIIVELFFPGFGVPGIAGIICIVAGFTIFAVTVGDFVQGAMLFLIVAVILGLALTVSMRMYAKGYLNKTQLVLNSELSAEEGFHSMDDAGVPTGAKGVVTTTLRPVGVVEINGKRWEASSEAAFIQKGTRVRVVSTEGRRITVAPDPQDDASAQTV